MSTCGRAGNCPDYYLGPEQGRDRRPSAEVLGALARALRLCDDATAHLFALAAPSRAARGRVPQPLVAPRPAAAHGVLAATPAFVQTGTCQILAANPLARALSPVHTPGNNLVRPRSWTPPEEALRLLASLAGDETYLGHVRARGVRQALYPVE